MELDRYKNPYNLTPEQVKELGEKLIILEDEIDKAFDESQTVEEYLSCACHEHYRYFKRVYKLYEEYELREIPDYGDHMTIEYFKECCDCGGFIDSDGFGVYATETQVSSIDVNPSDIETGLYRKDFTHVVWFNK